MKRLSKKEDFPIKKEVMVGEIMNYFIGLQDNYELEGLDFKTKQLAFYGSRSKYTKKEPRGDSDIDVLLEYNGKAREDDMFNCLNHNTLLINGLKVDFNPIKAEKSGTLSKYGINKEDMFIFHFGN